MSDQVNYTGYRKTPLHSKVFVTITHSGNVVDSPAGKAIGCSQTTPCDITWEIDLGNSTCPCAFNISCCANGITLSFWWYWDFHSYPHYRQFLDFGGIFIFYNPPNGYKHLSYRIFRYDDFQWYYNIGIPYGSWHHVAITLQSSKMNLFLDGRFLGTRNSYSPNKPTTKGKTLTPRAILKSTTGNYSFGTLHVWEKEQSAAFVWRQHYEEVETRDRG